VPDDKNRPSDPPNTPINSSGAYPVFRQTAEDLAKKLEKISDPDAWLRAGELRYYAESFSSWSPTNRPDELTRTKLVADYMKAYRSALEYLIRRRARGKR